METDLQLKWRSVAQAIFGKGIHGNCPFAAALPSNHWAVRIICFSSWIPHVVRLCIQGCDFWNVENGNMSSADRRSDIMKWGGRAPPPPSPTVSGRTWSGSVWSSGWKKWSLSGSFSGRLLARWSSWSYQQRNRGRLCLSPATHRL